MENKMKELAHLIGVEIGEKFKIIHKNGIELNLIFYFTENSVECNYVGTKPNIEKFIFDVIKGKSSIKKLPWKPKLGEVYYTPSYEYNDEYESIRFYAISVDWTNSIEDKLRYINCLCYKTEELCEQNFEKDIERINKILNEKVIETY